MDALLHMAARRCEPRSRDSSHLIEDPSELHVNIDVAVTCSALTTRGMRRRSGRMLAKYTQSHRSRPRRVADRTLADLVLSRRASRLMVPHDEACGPSKHVRDAIRAS